MRAQTWRANRPTFSPTPTGRRPRSTRRSTRCGEVRRRSHRQRPRLRREARPARTVEGRMKRSLDGAILRPRNAFIALRNTAPRLFVGHAGPSRRERYISISIPRGSLTFSDSGIRSRGSRELGSCASPSRPETNSRAGSLVLLRSGSVASSAAIRSPDADSRCSRRPLPAIGHELRAVPRPADLDVETFLSGQMGMIRLHRGDHRVDGPALEGMHGRRPSVVDMA